MQGYRLDRERGPTKVPLSRSGAQSAVRLPLGPLDSNVKDTTDLFLLGKGQGVAQQDYSAAVHSNRPIEQPTANPRPPGRSPEPPQVATSRHISECHILISGPGPGRLPSVAVAADLGSSLLSCLFEQPTHYLSGPYAKLSSPTYTGLI
jgi:hypothetical protein